MRVLPQALRFPHRSLGIVQPQIRLHSSSALSVKVHSCTADCCACKQRAAVRVLPQALCFPHRSLGIEQPQIHLHSNPAGKGGSQNIAAMQCSDKLMCRWEELRGW